MKANFRTAKPPQSGSMYPRISHRRCLKSRYAELVTFGLGLLTSVLCVSARGQSYSIDWSTIDGGGVTSTGGVYSVTGTIGQPDAGGPMTGGNYSLTGGFWALYAVQTDGAPTLSITNGAPGFAIISWNPASTSWVLQETLNLSPAGWTNSPSGVTNPAVVPATLPGKFYRLHKP
jgi:hypothetical protein